MIYRLHSLFFCAFASVALTLPALADNSSPKPGLSVKELISLKQARSAHLSPAADLIAYNLSVPRTLYKDADGSAWSELHVIDLHGKPVASYAGKVNVGSVAWAADASQVYFIASHSVSGRAGLYSLSPLSGEVTEVFFAASSMQSIYPSPDGSRIAFLAHPASSAPDSGLADMGFNAVVYEESDVSPQVWLLDLETRQARMQVLDGAVSDLAWNADSSHYAVAVASTPQEDAWEIARDIWVIDSQTGEVQSKLKISGKLGDFQWSPDGTKIAYIGAEDQFDPNPGRLFVVPVNGGKRVDLVPDYPGQIEDFYWLSADELSYIGSRGVWTGHHRASLSSPAISPAGSQGGPILRSLDGRIGQLTAVAIADTPQHPAEVFLLQPDVEPKRLTQSNPMLEQRNLAKQTAVTVPTRDGLELDAVLMYPLNQQAPPSAPLIIFVHGGPESHYSNGWMSSYDEPAQALAAQGFMLAFPNYRGSTGRGVTFSRLSQGDTAGSEFDDLVDTKAFMVDAGFTDASHTGVAGISYGGFAAMWAATALSEHFAAAVAFVGVSNQISMFGSTDIPREMYQVHARNWPWENWQLMLERSPVFHAGNARTPLLIMGGDSDRRFDPSQSLEMYRHLKLRTNTPVRLVVYPGEGHGNRDTASQFDYALRLERWMTYYLTGSDPGLITSLPPYLIDHAHYSNE